MPRKQTFLDFYQSIGTTVPFETISQLAVICQSGSLLAGQRDLTSSSEMTEFVTPQEFIAEGGAVRYGDWSCEDDVCLLTFCCMARFPAPLMRFDIGFCSGDSATGCRMARGMYSLYCETRCSITSILPFWFSMTLRPPCVMTYTRLDINDLDLLGVSDLCTVWIPIYKVASGAFDEVSSIS